MRRGLLLFLAVLSLHAFAQSDPVITSINPTSGPTAGGTTVVILGNNFRTNVLCILPCPPAVTFGDVTVNASEESNERLVVTTPPRLLGGTVDVTVQVTGEKPAVAQNAFTYLTGAEDDYERVLLPIYLDSDVSGAHGTRWRTDFWIRNNGPEAVTLAPWACPQEEACPAVFPLTYVLDAGLSLHNLPSFFQVPDGNPSRVLYVAHRATARVSFNLRVADVSRSTLNSGTDLPVIRSGDLLPGTTQLLAVPMNDPKFRVLLRVYDITHASATFRITLYPQSETMTQPVHTTTVTATTPQFGPFATKAAYAQFDVTDLLRLEKVWPQSVRIEVEPLVPGSRYWTFASVTNNDTQLVTLVTPQ